MLLAKYERSHFRQAKRRLVLEAIAGREARQVPLEVAAHVAEEREWNWNQQRRACVEQVKNAPASL